MATGPELIGGSPSIQSLVPRFPRFNAGESFGAPKFLDPISFRCEQFPKQLMSVGPTQV